MLKIAEQGDLWAGDTIELNMSFETLRDYQWDRLMKAVWSYPAVTGPFEERYTPRQPDPDPTAIKKPEPTAAYSEFGRFELAPDIQVGMEVLVTRSLFECVSILIPLTMFENLSLERDSEALAQLEKALYDFALKLYETTTFSIATIGINRGCQLLMEMITDNNVRDDFVKTGNFLVREDAMVALRLQPRLYKEVMPNLRWCPATRKPTTAATD